MRKLLYKKHKLIGNKGFSLVELIIVIAIMAVLMAVLAPQLIKYVEKSRVQTDDTAASEILNAVKVALTDEGIYSAIQDGDQVIWDGSDGSLTNTADTTAVTYNGAASTLDVALKAEIDSIVGAPGVAKSKTRKAQSFTVTVDVTADGVPTATMADADGWLP